MLIDEVRQRMTQAMRDRNGVAKSILRVALGDLQAAESRQHEPLNDAQAEAVVRKLIKSNQETIELTKDAAAADRLREEVAVLEALLPRTLSVDQIVAALEPAAERIKSAANDGQATGAAMKHLKQAGADVTGRDVAEAVRRVRGVSG